jgi:hypothetical protein
VTVTQLRCEQRTYRMKGESVKVYTAGGKEVNAKDLPDKLKQQTIVLLSHDGKKVDPFYLKIIKPDTLILVPPPPVLAPVGTAPVPEPLPEKPAKPEDKPRTR